MRTILSCAPNPIRPSFSFFFSNVETGTDPEAHTNTHFIYLRGARGFGFSSTPAPERSAWGQYEPQWGIRAFGGTGYCASSAHHLSLDRMNCVQSVPGSEGVKFRERGESLS